MGTFTTEQELREIYYDPKTGFQGAEALYQEAKDQGLQVTKKYVKDWLKTQATYTRHKPLVRKHKYRKTYVKNLGEQVQTDLVDMGKFKSKNDKYYWILTCVEILSRYAFTYPVLRKDTENMSEAVNLFLEEFKKRFGTFPKNAQFDEGKEFYNVGARELLKGYDVTYFSTFSDKKAAVVERFNKTLKTKMWKYFHENDTNRWIDVLDDLTENYNNAKHGVTKFRPADVDKDNEKEVWNNLYGYDLAIFPLPKYKLGDRVRITKYKKPFEKGYEPNFTEIFTIVAVHRGDPTVYRVKDDEDEEISGIFYEEELSPVTEVTGDDGEDDNLDELTRNLEKKLAKEDDVDDDGDDTEEPNLPSVIQRTEKDNIRADKARQLRNLNIANLEVSPENIRTARFLDSIEVLRDKRNKKDEILIAIKYKGRRIINIDRHSQEVKYSPTGGGVRNSIRFYEEMLGEAKKETPTLVTQIDESAGVILQPDVTEDIVEKTQIDVRQEKDIELHDIESYIDDVYERVTSPKKEGETSFTDPAKVVPDIDESTERAKSSIDAVLENLRKFKKIQKEVEEQQSVSGLPKKLARDKGRQEKAGAKEDKPRQIITALSEAELNQDELSLPKRELMKLVEDKLKALVGKPTGDTTNTSEQAQWRKLATDQRARAIAIDERLKQPNTVEETAKLEDKRKINIRNAQLYDKLADLCDTRADEIRLQVGLKPEGGRVKKILKNNTEADPRTKFQRLAKWLTKNKYVNAFGIVVSILGGLAAMSGFLYEVLKKSAHSTNATSAYQTIKDLAEYVSEKGKVLYTAIMGVGSVVYSILSMLSGLVQTVAYYMWIVIIALAYFVYKNIIKK